MRKQKRPAEPGRFTSHPLSLPSLLLPPHTNTMPLFASRLGASTAKHPYSPATAVLPHGYAPATMPFGLVLAAFFGATAAGSVATWRFASECGGVWGWWRRGGAPRGVAFFRRRPPSHAPLNPAHSPPHTARRGLASREAAIVTWLTVTGFIHVLVEGYVVHTPDFAADSSGNLFAEICEWLVVWISVCGGPQLAWRLCPVCWGQDQPKLVAKQNANPLLNPFF